MKTRKNTIKKQFAPIEKRIKIVFKEDPESANKDDLKVCYSIKADISNFTEREKKVKLLKDNYIAYRDAIVGIARAMCRVITHDNKQDIKSLSRAYVIGVFALLTEMDTFEFLIRYDDSPYARKILNDLAKINVEEEVKKAAEEEMKYSAVTNNELSKQAEKNKNEILKKLDEVFEKYNEKHQPNIIKMLIDDGKLKQEPDTKTGKYISFQTPMDFFCWCYENGYEDKINALFVAEHIKTKCSLETLKKYERDARDITDTKRESRRIH
jgi:hypothetical protein